MLRLVVSHEHRPETGNELAVVTRRLMVGDRQVDLELPQTIWRALDDIGVRERLTVHQLVNRMHGSRPSRVSLAVMIRLFVITYFRAAAIASASGPSDPWRLRAGD